MRTFYCTVDYGSTAFTARGKSRAEAWGYAVADLRDPAVSGRWHQPAPGLVEHLIVLTENEWYELAKWPRSAFVALKKAMTPETPEDELMMVG